MNYYRRERDLPKIPFVSPVLCGYQQAIADVEAGIGSSFASHIDAPQAFMEKSIMGVEGIPMKVLSNCNRTLFTIFVM